MSNRVQKLFTYADMFLRKPLKLGKNVNDFGWPTRLFHVPPLAPLPPPPPLPPKVLKRRIEFSAYHQPSQKK